MNKQIETKSESPALQKNSPCKIKAQEVQELSPQDEALLELGKKLVVESIDITRDFAKTILTTSSGFAVLYLTILNFLKESIKQLSHSERLLVVMPSGFFLLSTVFAIMTFFPRMEEYSLNILDEIEESMNRWIRSKRKYMIIAAVLFLLGIQSILVAFGYLILKVP